MTVGVWPPKDILGEEFLGFGELGRKAVVYCVVSSCGGAGKQTVLFWG
jgi:hypothetical protein